MNKPIFIIMLTIALSAGYPLAKGLAQYPKPLVEIQNVELAKVILSPQHKYLSVSHDPFEPIVVPEMVSAMSSGKVGVTAVEDALNDVQVMGIVRLDQEFRAYIKVGDKTRVVGLHDKVYKFTITDINMDQVVFRSGDKEIIKKRGKL